jgi:predicted RNase H-like HicB family nuclease
MRLNVPKKQDFSKRALSSVLVTCLKFAVLVEKDESGYFVASVPELPGCHTQAKTLDELNKRIKEAIEAYLEVEGAKPKEGISLVGLQFIEVTTS